MRYLILLLLLSCSKQPQVTHFRGIAMTIPYHIQIGQKLSNSEKKHVETLIQNTFDHINNTFNRFNPASELSLLNAKTHTDVSDSLLFLINLSIDIHRETNGFFDPTLGKGLKAVQISNNHLEKPLDVTLDLDGIAKGHSVDLLHDALIRYPSLYINWGGDIRVRGRHPENRPWRIFLAGQNRVIEVEDIALATSGTEFKPGHIINPKTKQPIRAEHPHTATATTCARADALATAHLIP